MKDKEKHLNFDIPKGLNDQLEGFQKELSRVKKLEALFAAVIGLILSYLVVFIIDRFFDTPGILRFLILVLGTLNAAIFAPYWIRKWVFGYQTPNQLAKLISKRFPRFGDRLLGILELRDQDEVAQQMSPALCNAAVGQVAEEALRQDFAKAIPNKQRHKKWGKYVGVGSAIVLLVALLFSGASSSAFKRWLLPFSDAVRYTFAKLRGVEERMVVPRGEKVAFEPTLDTESKWQPKKAWVKLPGQKRIESELKEERYSFDLPGQSKPKSMKVGAGDDRRKVQLVPMVRPALKGLEAEVQLPDYLGYPNQTEDLRDGIADFLVGSQVTLKGEVSRELQEVAIVDPAQSLHVNGAQFSSEPMSFDGSKSEVSFTWKDVEGLGPKEPFVLKINNKEDTAPVASCEGIIKENILEDDILDFDVVAHDDYGVKEVGIVWSTYDDSFNKLAEGEIKGEAKLADIVDKQKRKVGRRATFVPQELGIKPQAIAIQAYATDHLPGRERVLSKEYIIHVVDPETHAKLLKEEFNRNQERLQEIAQREDELHTENRALRDLPEDQLADEETLRRLEEQAQGEREQQQAIQELTRDMEELFGEALRNREFDRDALEQIAEMIGILQELAEQGVPGVAELLERAQQLAEAAGQAGQQGEGQGGEPQEGQQGGEPQEGQQGGGQPGSQSEGEQGRIEGEGGSGDEQSQQQQQQQEQQGGEQRGPNEGMTQEEGGGGGGGGGSGGGPQPIVPDKAPEGEEELEEDAQEALEEAVQEQEEVMERMNEAMARSNEADEELELDSFVNRLRWAGQKEDDIADALLRELPKSIGLSASKLGKEQRGMLAELAEEEEVNQDDVRFIQEDLGHFFRRTDEVIYDDVYQAMDESGIADALEEKASKIRANLGGESIRESREWSEKLYEWAKMLAGEDDGGGGGGGGGGGQPDEDMIELMMELLRLAHEEARLRNRTRDVDLERVHEEIEKEVYNKKADRLARKQDELAGDVQEIIADQDQSNDQLIGLLEDVEEAMADTTDLLDEPKTDGETIAAETEVIERIMAAFQEAAGQAGGGGGAGSAMGQMMGNSPGQGSGNSSDVANRDHDGEANWNETDATREEIRKATGRMLESLPVEFREAVGEYFKQVDRLEDRQ